MINELTNAYVQFQVLDQTVPIVGQTQIDLVVLPLVQEYFHLVLGCTLA
jgi:hypothetical protein